jgi:hypothetical protein
MMDVPIETLSASIVFFVAAGLQGKAMSEVGQDEAADRHPGV